MSRTYSLRDVAQHSSKESPWFVIKDKVYDATKLLDEHPGGGEVLMDYAGKNATAGFNSRIHSDDAKKWMKDFEIGTLGDSSKKWYQCPLCYTAAGVGVAAVAVLIAVTVYRSYKR